LDRRVVLVSEEIYGGDGSSFISLVDSTSGRLLWRKSSGHFLHKLLLSPSGLFVSAYQTIAKFDLTTGATKWTHSFGKSPLAKAFKYFGEPVKSGRTVKYPLEQQDAERARREGWPPAVVVDDESGRIIEPVILP